MTAIGSGDIIDLAAVLGASVADNGAVMLHVGDVHSGEGIDEDVPFFQTPGFVSVFDAPEPGSAAGEVIVKKTGGGDWAFAGRDVRGLRIAGNLKLGEACAYAPKGAARSLWKNDGRIVQFTTDDNTDQGRSVYSQTGPTGFVWFSPWGKITYGEPGYHVLHVSGARLDLGGIGAPGLPPSLNSYATLSAQSVRIEGALISLGTAAGVVEPVAKATTLYALLTSISGSLSAIGVQLTAIAAAAQPAASPTSTVATVPAVAAALTALAATIASTSGEIAAALLTLPSASTQTT